MKNNKRTLINRFLWWFQCRRTLKKFTRIKLNDFYLDLLKNGHKSKYPKWKVQASIKYCIEELARRDKLNKSKARVCGSN